MIHGLRTLLLVVSSAIYLTAQAVPEKAPAADAEKLRKEAVAFLRETQTDVNSMRSLENRIGFTAEIAALMWYHDEREARSIFAGAIRDYRDLLARYDGQLNALGPKPEGSGNPYLGFLTEPNERQRAIKKLRMSISVGQTIAMSLAEHDPELAYTFYYESIAAISSPDLRGELDSRDRYFESQLLARIAENNPARAVLLGSRSLKKGFSSYHVALLKKIYSRDPAKASEFGSAILGWIASNKLERERFSEISDLLKFGAEVLQKSRESGGKKAVYTSGELRQIAELFAQAVANETPDSDLIDYIRQIEPFVPGRAAQIRAKFTGELKALESDLATGPASTPVASNTNIRLTANSNSSVQIGMTTDEIEVNAEAEKKLLEDVQNLGNTKLTKEEREKIVGNTRRVIAQQQGRIARVSALTMLAAQVAKMGDKDLAAQVMRDARSLISPTPKTYQDFLMNWTLVTAYVDIEPEQAFTLLEETLARANVTVEAFVKVGEFMDVAEEMIDDGEVLVGAFGAGFMAGGAVMTRDFAAADPTINALAKTDFGKLKNLANHFERNEIRVMAKMMVLSSVLGPKKALVTELDTETDIGP